jgi:redox-sensing transcriptional repressor
MISQRTIARLSLYRRLLQEVAAKGIKNIYSHQMAAIAGTTAAQVRRDWMVIGYSGSPAHGYEVADLIDAIGKFLDSAVEQKVALIGIGNLGRAVLVYFTGRRPKLSIAAAFDTDPHKVSRVIHGCRCYPMEQLKEIITANEIKVAVIAVPAPEAQYVAESLIAAGVRGLLNFAPVPLYVPAGVFVENIDLTMSLEKVAYFSRQNP